MFGIACLICGCTSDDSTTYGSAHNVYGDWLYYQQDWYDDDFWLWVDDHPECCEDQDDLKLALATWYDDLDPGHQQMVRDRVETWMDEHGVVPAAGQSPRELVLETASQRWTALTPAERRQWLDDRRARIEQRLKNRSSSRLSSDRPAAFGDGAADLNPEQRAALRESAQGASFERYSGRGSPGAHRSISRHPTPNRAGLSGGVRFQAVRGGSRGGRGGRGR